MPRRTRTGGRPRPTGPGRPTRSPSCIGRSCRGWRQPSASSPDQLGGDFYDLFPVAGGRWAFFLGDVCGKGPEAASLTSLTRCTLRDAAHHDPDPAAALATLNAVVHERYTAGGNPRGCTCVFGVIEPAGDHGPATVRLAPGGHPPALLLRSDGHAEYLPTTGGMLVGVLPGAPAATTSTARTPCARSAPTTRLPHRTR